MQCVFVAEQAGEANGTSLGDNLEVVRDLSTIGQRAPLGCHALDVAAQFDLFHEQRISSRAIFRALVRKMSRIGSDKLPGG